MQRATTVGVSEAQRDIATARLERTLLRAPFDGVIAEINGELGEFVTPSPVGVPTPPTVDLIDSTCLYISAPIDEVDAPAVKTGQQALISMDAFPGRRFPGFVRRVAPYVLDVEKTGAYRRGRSRDQRSGGFGRRRLDAVTGL